MELDIYQIDAFAEKVFQGNPACVVPLKKWLDDEILKKIAQENYVPETAFFVKQDNGYHLRWFTPEVEMDLCGHATLASAYVIKKYLNFSENTILFKTLSGILKVYIEEEKIKLDLPSREPKNSDLPDFIKKSLNIQPIKILKSRDYFLVYDKQEEIEKITINTDMFNQVDLNIGGVIVTSVGNNSDFVSRFFTPRSSILEDPVTGSAHCSLIPYWSKVLNKKEMTAIQLSKRQGKLYCIDKNERVLVSGSAKTYSIGKVFLA
ncbi:MAG: isomerase [Flavobacteriaceae bacterium]|nr:isomerase [Flavobacteriaceae bacterium]|tara:strand:- start:8023 stop:8811 length:789 start_codon:yes stop_codon:yes gene_type:complete